MDYASVIGNWGCTVTAHISFQINWDALHMQVKEAR